MARGVGPCNSHRPKPTVSGGVPTSLADVRVLFNGTPAAILYAWTNQLAAVVPYGIAIGKTAQVVVQYGSQTSAPFGVAVAATAPGLITADASGQGQAKALNADGSANSASKPAAAGSVIS